MNKFKIVFMFNFLNHLKTKAFIVSCFFMFLSVVSIFAYNHFKSDEENTNIGLINNGEYDFQLKDFENNSNYKIKIYKTEEELLKNMDEEDISSYFLIEKNNEISYFYKGMGEVEQLYYFKSFIKNLELNKIIKENEVDVNLINKITSDVEIKQISINETGEKFGIIYLFVLFLYTFIIMFGQLVSNSIVSEKTTKVMEILLPKVNSLTMMYSKIFSILCVGLIQISMIPLGFLVSSIFGWSNVKYIDILNIRIDFTQITPSILFLFVIYFILGFLLYSLIFAAIGSVVQRTEDLQPLITPFIFLTMASLFLGMRTIFAPDELYIRISSYIPFFTPMVTFSRYMMGEANNFEMIITFIILILSIFVISVIASIIYKKGVMKYSNKVSFKDIIEMIKK